MTQDVLGLLPMLAVGLLSFICQKDAVTSGECWKQPHHCLGEKVKNCLVSNRGGKGGQEELIATYTSIITGSVVNVP